jgi:SAM-dependent methyltransferase
MINDNWRPYLEGTAFSRGLTLSLSPHDQPVQSHLEVIKEALAGKTVIHVGCCDHLPLIDQKRAQGTWLHDTLCGFTRRCLGLDINREAVDYLTARLGYKDIICHDLTSPALPPEITSRKWDAMFMGDMLEHLDDPVQFLSEVHGIYKGQVDRLLVSGPHAFSFQNFMFMLKNQECVNTDHRYWFTVYTLAKILTRAGFKPVFYALANRAPLTARRDTLPELVTRLFPACHDSIVMGAMF